jgi:Flp pilus assembly protein TadD
MDVGLDLFYKRGDANGAVNEFRKVLGQNPTHYGATMQLAKALDYAGRHAEAKPYWQRMAAMADSIHDKKTLDTAQARLRRVW